MEIVGYGILLAIGFYIAPLLITVVFGAVMAVFAGIANLFNK